MGKKRKQIEEKPAEVAEAVPEISSLRQSDEPPAKKLKWINKQRCLVLGSRGLIFRQRHLMNDLRSFMPHCKMEGKKESKDDLSILNEIAEVRNCNKCLYFECRKKKDLYLWMSNTPSGPSVKFHVINIHTKGELKFSGNCLQGTRPLLTFDKSFEAPHWGLMRELLTSIFNTPNQHPKSQPFFDHVITFAVIDDKIWFRHFQILEEDGQLTEIGPRFVLNPIKVFDGSFGGATLWANSKFVTPNVIRSKHKLLQTQKYMDRSASRTAMKLKEFAPGQEAFRGDPTSDVFETASPSKKSKENGKSMVEDEEVESEEEKSKKPKKTFDKPRTKKAMRKMQRQKIIFGRNTVKPR